MQEGPSFVTARLTAADEATKPGTVERDGRRADMRTGKAEGLGNAVGAAMHQCPLQERGVGTSSAGG